MGAPSAISISASTPSNSFTADTPILMADGTTNPIADIDIGDWVWATDPATGLSEPKLPHYGEAGEGRPTEKSGDLRVLCGQAASTSA